MMVARKRPVVLGLAFLPFLACGDDVSGRRSPGGDADPSAAPDASRDDGADAALADPNVIVFENEGDTFTWTCQWWVGDVSEGGPGQWLDLTQPAAAQSGDGGRSRIQCDKIAERDLSTEGYIWFQSWPDPDAPGTDAFFAAGQPVVREGNEEGYDVHATPPLVMEVGDVVGPDADWVSGEPEADGYPRGLQTAHIQDASHSSPASEVFFASGIAGLRFTAEDGVHYGFVELELVLDDWYVFRAEWRAVRWGFNTQPDAPLTIPP